MKAKIILWSFLAVFAEGCKQMPPLEQQNIEYPHRTRSGVKYTPNNMDLSRYCWWKKLKNPELNQLIAQALAQNNEIKNANASIQQAQAQLKAAQYDWFPVLDASARGFNASSLNGDLAPKGNLANSGILSDSSNLNIHGYYAGFSPSYSLNILNNLNHVKAAGASLAIKQAIAQATRLAIISQVSSSYFMLLSQKEELRLEKALVRDLQELRHLEQVRYKKGVSTIEKIMSIDQDLSQEKVKIPQIEGAIAHIENAIHLLLNENPGPVHTHYKLHSLDIRYLIPRQLPSSVLKNRPDIMIALNNLKTAEARIGQAYSLFFPSISLTGMGGGTSIALKKILGLTSGFWADQAFASIKVLNGSAYHNVQSAKADYRAIYYAYLQTLRAAFADVDNNLTNEKKKQIAYLQTHEGYRAAKRTYDLTLVQYQSGARDYRDTVSAKINRDKYQLYSVRQKAQLLDSIVQVFNAVAGGYDAEQGEPTHK